MKISEAENASKCDPLRQLINKIFLNGGYVNAHSHLDRSYTITEESLKRSNDHLFAKWEFVDGVKRNSSLDDYRSRIKKALQMQKFMNTQAICSFIDVDPVADYTALTAATIARDDVEDIQLKIACQTLKGVLEKEPRELLENVIDSVDIIGSLPGADPGKEAKHLDVVMGWAKASGKRLHVHVDQLNRPKEKETELLARKTIEHGLEGRVTAVHSISLACHPKSYRDEVYRMCRDADLTFIACPSAWIDHRRSEVMAPIHNSITPVDELLHWGLRVACGSDNIHDVYKPYCDGDMINEMRLLIDSCRIYNEDEIVNIMVHNGLEILGCFDT